MIEWIKDKIDGFLEECFWGLYALVGLAGSILVILIERFPFLEKVADRLLGAGNDGGPDENI